MTDRNLNIRVSLSAANRLSGPLNAASRAAAGLSSQIKNTHNTARNLQSQARTFERVTTSVQKTSEAYEKAKKKVKELRDQMPPLAQQTDAQRRALQTARTERDRFGRTLDNEKQRLRNVSAELYRHGISARNSGDVTGQVTRRTEAYNRQLAEQQRRLTAVTGAQARYTAAREMRGKLATTGAAAMGAGAASMYGMARFIAPGRDFDARMANVQALTNLERNSPQYNMLREQAKELGASTAFTATDAAMGQKFLATAGFTPDAIKAALPGILNMALAGEVDLGESADMGAKILSQFKLNPDQMDRLSDVLTATFTGSTTNLLELSEAMKYAAPVAADLGISLESMAAMAGVMADNGTTGSMAGTALRAGLSRLVAPTGGAADAMAALGIKIKGANGELRSADDILKDMAVSLRQYDQPSQILLKKMIFGEEAMVGMGSVVNGMLDGKYAEKKANNDNAKGRAKKIADTNANSWDGDLKSLASAWEGLRIEIKEQVDPVLRSVTQSITGMIRRATEWANKNKELTKTLALGAAAIGIAVTAFGALALAAAAVIVPFAALRLSVFMLTRGGGLVTMFPLLGRLSTGLRGLLPSLGGVSRSITGWKTIFQNAGTAIGNLATRIQGRFTALKSGAMAAKRGLVMVFTQPMTVLSMLRNGLKGLASGGFGALRIAFQAALSVIGGGLSLLFSPLGLLIAVIVAAAVLIWKYWEPIKAWFSGFFSGLMEAIAPVRDTLAGAFAPFAPIFDAIGSAIKKVWEWFTSLFEPVNTSAEGLKAATEAGQTFGRLVGAAIASVANVIAAVAKGVGWLLEKLGVIPDATKAAADAANAMGPVNLPEVQKSVKWVWDDKAKKMVKQEWTPTPPNNAVAKAAEKAEESKPKVETPALPAFGSKVYDPKENKKKDKKGTEAMDAAGSAAPQADPNKLGEIVFKNRPSVIPIDGSYQEPRLQQPSLLSRLTEKLQPVQPALSGVPVPITPARVGVENKAQDDRYTINLHFHGVDMTDARSIGEKVRIEVAKIMQKNGVRRRSSLYDED
ncbi:phage tail tape measure protein [Xenorhabdus sp. DI]|uniref:phage tail tape measure protein n=1 Tax=Xenorhabdus doucetiae TaxID=351671 RepID=UPI00199EA017|nr:MULTISPECIES: phage tail tape measure protein [unclassified Xenorhabdus]MBD2783683.1 phage tail tape measure protein [Xenorhabdus sp. 3]MBD2789866.1 phage tail tape measure protein [Xenorhabdus sp. DI]